ncbi:hypothetical protein PSECIP111951_01789 [Pseudoalteromonas holothuriae]|uniref:Uncharacterized protein n=1 Tax=Pseudoalteromonas holothuriae TaxID=2963714 RepID=A0A9W4QYJ4_9GAMM|nr:MULTISPECIES: hypothetical protein [unclassified Pseudoalteromonas]CAH9058039.1 hypothetical protein PSECIP111951_01789 [Pseudoalteromonas sp. CIP111951]CAH9058648.1 hypothetical protein PSECIP111854_02245 [Pseudoalteromonas sp. CIP111854]
MKLKLNKKKIKNLTNDVNELPKDMTPQVAGGFYSRRGQFGCGSWWRCQNPTENNIVPADNTNKL